jgi:hypothetical protein
MTLFFKIRLSLSILQFLELFGIISSKMQNPENFHLDFHLDFFAILIFKICVCDLFRENLALPNFSKI